MSTMEINNLAAAVLVAGLVFMAINVGVDEAFHEQGVENTVDPVPAREETVAAAPGVAAQEAAPETPLAVLLAQADPAKGEKVAKKCKSCHDMTSDGRNKVGPNLWGVVGADKAARPGFAYSEALAGLGGAWGYEQLDAFLGKPKAYAPGTKMAFAGVKKPAARANLIAYLRTLSENPPPLP